MRVFIFFQELQICYERKRVSVLRKNSEAGGVMKPGAVAHGAMKPPAGAVRFLYTTFLYMPYFQNIV